MLTPGNRKLGGDLIWGFGLPSGMPEVCVGMTPTCQAHCYAIRYAQYRTSAQAKYQRNLELSRLPDFAQRMRYFILNQDIKVVRIHTGGDFYSLSMPVNGCVSWRWLPEVQFFSYTRSWRVPGLSGSLIRWQTSQCPYVVLVRSRHRYTHEVYLRPYGSAG